MAESTVARPAPKINGLPLVASGEPFQLRVNRKNRTGEMRWYAMFTCDCGKTFRSTVQDVRSGRRKSCGCLRRSIGELYRTHGMSKTATYRIWCGMWRRCTNTASASYPRYGGRGIVVCERWAQFENFLEDVGERPSPQHSIDRINNDGDYTPGNVRWAVAKEQSRNTRANKILTVAGESKTVAEWAEVIGCDPRVLHLRLTRGWTAEQAVRGTGAKLLSGERSPSAKLTREDVRAIRESSGVSGRKLAAMYGVSQSQIRNILSRKHWS